MLQFKLVWSGFIDTINIYILMVAPTISYLIQDKQIIVIM